MLVSIKIKKSISAEIKEQESFLKKLEMQEINYKIDLSKERSSVEKIIENYNKILKDM